MSDKRKFDNYKNIDFDETEYNDNHNDLNSNVKEQHTLDFYNDDMSKKAVKSIFDINNEPEQKDENFFQDSFKSKKTYGYDGTNKHNTYRPEQMKQLDDNGNIEYTKQSFDYDKLNEDVKNGYKYGGSQNRYDYRNTSFSQERINAERRDREELERNKQILKRYEEEEKNKLGESKVFKPYKTVREVQDSFDTERQAPRRAGHSNKKRKQIMYFRLFTTAFIIIILACLCINIYSNIKLKEEVKTLSAENERLTRENGEVQSLQSEIDILNDELVKLRTETPATEGENTGTDASADETDTEKVTQYTVKSGDTLSSISQSVYGDPNRYNEIYTANNLTSTNLVSGQILQIP